MIVAVLAILSLFLANFMKPIYTILLFGQILSILSLLALAFQMFMILILPTNAKKISMLCVMLGSLGVGIGFISQLMQNQISDKPPIIHLSIVFLAVGIIVECNKKLKND